MEDGVEQAEVPHVQHRAVNIGGQLEGVEGKPAHGKHHHHGHQHLGGFAASAVAFGGDAAVDTTLCWTDMTTQFGPDPGVGKGNDGQGEEILQDKHGDAVDGAICVCPGPFLHTRL